MDSDRYGDGRVQKPLLLRSARRKTRSQSSVWRHVPLGSRPVAGTRKEHERPREIIAPDRRGSSSAMFWKTQRIPVLAGVKKKITGIFRSARAG